MRGHFQRALCLLEVGLEVPGGLALALGRVR